MTQTVSIGLFGGSFDPPHIAHVALLDELQRVFFFDEIRLIPCGQHALKKQFAVTAADRLEMLKRAIASRPRLSIDDIELRSREISYTVNTCEKICRAFADSNKVLAFNQARDSLRLTLIVGSDILTQLHLWHRWDELLQWVNLAVVYRPQSASEVQTATSLAELLAIESAENDVSAHLLAREYDLSSGTTKATGADMPLRGIVTFHSLSSWALSSTQIRQEISDYWGDFDGSAARRQKDRKDSKDRNEREAWLVDAVGPEVWAYIKARNLYRLGV